MKYIIGAAFFIVMLMFGGKQNQLFLTVPVGFVTMWATFILWEKLINKDPFEKEKTLHLVALLGMMFVWMYLLVKFNSWVTG